MELELLALDSANRKLETTQSMDAADDVCIESRASYIAFIDDCAWSHSINILTQSRLSKLLRESKSALEQFLEHLMDDDRKQVPLYLDAISERIHKVETYALSRTFDPTDETGCVFENVSIACP